jgi:hypothetical protein
VEWLGADSRGLRASLVGGVLRLLLLLVRGERLEGGKLSEGSGVVEGVRVRSGEMHPMCCAMVRGAASHAHVVPTAAHQTPSV